MPSLTHIDAYDYELPPELIAQEPPTERDGGRLMVIDRQAQTISHRQIRDLPEFLRPRDCLVLNNSRVVPAKLQGVRTKTGGKWEGLFLGLTPEKYWKLIGQTRGRLELGETVTLTAGSSELRLELLDRGVEGVWIWRPQSENDAWTLLDRFGTVPLPPYIARTEFRAEDRDRYQTTFAQTPGSVAAPTAGLHFTPELLERCRDRGVDRAEVTLHVGLGTFRPVNVTDIREHVMHPEWCTLSTATASKLATVRTEGGRIVAVGTTATRTLETAVAAQGWTGWEGESRLFISPPYEFRAVDVLLTNFHLPKSTLLMLVSAFAGYELTRSAYASAVAERYRFFSYGDAMLIV
ncbi:MAG: tRNA preQ1(34) S-adenosylmethionine ribosyltransferase-isomerase QueA [Planctomycetaceae bacterium]|nr:tRNA preQ1(34) S-adenosylmethionine ribosyltransferase-isomerase QueA [Planctomycetaceae bacterium]